MPGSVAALARHFPSGSVQAFHTGSGVCWGGRNWCGSVQEMSVVLAAKLDREIIRHLDCLPELLKHQNHPYNQCQNQCSGENPANGYPRAENKDQTQ